MNSQGTKKETAVGLEDDINSNFLSISNISNPFKHFQTKINLQKRWKLDETLMHFNNYNEINSTLAHSLNNTKSGYEGQLLDNLVAQLINEKSDVLKIEYLNFLNENLLNIIKDDSRVEFLIRFFLDYLKENAYTTNQNIRFHIIRIMTNAVVVFDVYWKWPEQFERYKATLVQISKDVKNPNRYVRAVSCQSLQELEILYPGLLEKEVYEDQNRKQGKDTLPPEETSGKNKSTMSIASGRPSPSMISDISGFLSALSVRNYSLVNHGTKSTALTNSNIQNLLKKEEEKERRLKTYIDFYRLEKSHISINYLLLVLDISLNFIKSDLLSGLRVRTKKDHKFEMKKNVAYQVFTVEFAKEIADCYERGISLQSLLQPKTADLVKRLISILISEINSVYYFTKIKFMEVLTLFLYIYEMPANVVLPIYSDMLKFHGNLHILSILLIVRKYYSSLSEILCEEIVSRLYSDINNNTLSYRERFLVLFWINYLYRFTPDGEQGGKSRTTIFQRGNKFRTFIYKRITELLPKPNDSYILKEKKVLTFLMFFEGTNDQAESDTIIRLINNYQIFKNFTVDSDITELIFRSLYHTLIRLPFACYTLPIKKFIYDVLQHKPKFSENVIKLLERMKQEERSLRCFEGSKSLGAIIDEILEGFAGFLTKLEPANNIKKYFNLIFYSIKEPRINPKPILFSLLRLVQAQELDQSNQDYIISNENVFYISKRVLHNYDFDEILTSLLEIFSYLSNNSEECSIRDSANIYRMLLSNLNKHKLEKIFTRQPKLNPEIFSYNSAQKYIVLSERETENMVFLKKSLSERKELGVEDGCCSIFGNFDQFLFKLYAYSNDLFTNFLNIDSYSTHFSIFDRSEVMDPSQATILSEDIGRIVMNGQNRNSALSLKKSGSDVFKQGVGNLFEVEARLQKLYTSKLRSEKKLGSDYLYKCIKSRFSVLFSEKGQGLRQKLFEMVKERYERCPPYITFPLDFGLNSKNLSESKASLFSIIILFSESQNYREISSVFVPYLPVTKIPILYKILLKIFVTNPIPQLIRTGFFFSTQKERMYLATGPLISLQVEDFFLPVEIEDDIINSISKLAADGQSSCSKEEEVGDSDETNKENSFDNEDQNILSRMVYRMAYFKYLWERTDSGSFEAARIINNTKESILTLNAQNLKHFWVHEPITFSASANLEKKSCWDFFLKYSSIFDDFDFQAEKDFAVNKDKQFSDELVISPIMIFLPHQYYLLFILAIADHCTLIRIKTNRWEMMKYLDDFFKKWQSSDKRG